MLEDLAAHPPIVDINLVVAVSDSRGLISIDDLTLNEQPIAVEPGTGLKQLAQGFHKTLDLRQLDVTNPLNFDLNFILQGMGQLQVTPIGKSTQVELSSSWPHPSFIGDYLPIASDITPIRI